MDELSVFLKELIVCWAHTLPTQKGVAEGGGPVFSLIWGLTKHGSLLQRWHLSSFLKDIYFINNQRCKS